MQVSNAFQHALLETESVFSWDRTAIIWKITGGTVEICLKLFHPISTGGFVNQVAWSPDGLQLLTRTQKGIKVWDPHVRLYLHIVVRLLRLTPGCYLDWCRPTRDQPRADHSVCCMDAKRKGVLVCRVCDAARNGHCVSHKPCSIGKLSTPQG